MPGRVRISMTQTNRLSRFVGYQPSCDSRYWTIEMWKGKLIEPVSGTCRSISTTGPRPPHEIER